jgi:diacylglycerol kinase family enzyme
VLAFRSLSLGTMLTVVASALGSGRRARGHRTSDYRIDLEGLEVTGHGPFPYQVDGDYLGEADHLVLRHEPAALRLVTP